MPRRGNTVKKLLQRSDRVSHHVLWGFFGGERIVLLNFNPLSFQLQNLHDFLSSEFKLRFYSDLFGFFPPTSGFLNSLKIWSYFCNRSTLKANVIFSFDWFLFRDPDTYSYDTAGTDNQIGPLKTLLRDTFLKFPSVHTCSSDAAVCKSVRSYVSTSANFLLDFVQMSLLVSK